MVTRDPRPPEFRWAKTGAAPALAMAHTKLAVLIKSLPNCRCLGVLYKDTNPSDDEYINLDIRVMGQTVLLGWIQLL